jgi:hypothetical protein
MSSADQDQQLGGWVRHKKRRGVEASVHEDGERQMETYDEADE